MYDIFLISDDVAGEKMAGPGIRAWELARCLARKFEVVLAAPDYSVKSSEKRLSEKTDFRVLHYSLADSALIEETGKKSRIIITQGYILSKFPVLKTLPAHLICDLYVPFPLENLFIHQKKIPSLKDREYTHLKDLEVYNSQLRRGDHFLCANIRQRDLFAGSLLSCSRINPRYLDRSFVLDNLISIVPFGISPEDSQGKEKERRDVLRKRFPEIQPDHVLFFWGGVISNWFDPLTLIKAVKNAVSVNPKIKLLFLSTRHANPLLPGLDMAQEAMDLSEALGLTGKHVFFNHEWVDYRERGDYFSAADVGVSIHINHFETYYSFRTRILDYLKYELPVLCTEGDYFAELVKEKKLGISVGSENIDELTSAVLKLAENKKKRGEIKARMTTVKEQFYWETVSEPLVRYCRRVLSGEEKKKTSPERREKKTFKAGSKKHVRRFFLRLPMKVSSKIRRLLKY